MKWPLEMWKRKNIFTNCYIYIYIYILINLADDFVHSYKRLIIMYNLSRISDFVTCNFKFISGSSEGEKNANCKLANVKKGRNVK